MIGEGGVSGWHALGPKITGPGNSDMEIHLNSSAHIIFFLLDALQNLLFVFQKIRGCAIFKKCVYLNFLQGFEFCLMSFAKSMRM